MWWCGIVSSHQSPPENPLHTNTPKHTQTHTHTFALVHTLCTSRQVSRAFRCGRAKEARTVHVQNDKGCFYTCHDPFNHLPLQTGESGIQGLPEAFAPATLDKLPFTGEQGEKTCAGIKFNCVFHKIRSKYVRVYGLWEQEVNIENRFLHPVWVRERISHQENFSFRF